MTGNFLWYKEAIIYEVHVRCFYDSNGDGIGDFQGLTEKLGYLQDLGVTAIWLLPFYPSPLKDDGYDIANYMDVHPSYGTLRDFRNFLREAHMRGIKVITELVLNHTSIDHPWFQRARTAKKGSRYRDYYVWNDSPEKYTEARIIFQDFETSNWTWDPIAKSYYWHRFYSHQPDLNYANPEVQKAVIRVLHFWLDMGVDGVRFDAVPYLFEKEGTNCENLPETHGVLKKLRSYVDTHFKEKMFLAEANQWPEDAAKYFGDGDECHMAFHFPLMPRLFMSIHLEDNLPIIEILSQTPQIPDSCQWALFLRNHDELTLEMVTDEERDYMFRVYAHDPQARINLGIRRRLAPLLKNDRRKIELMNVLLYSLLGTPVLYYGDELGMGDNIYLGDRNGVRTPMQWSSDKNAGFSRTNPQRLYFPPITDPEYHYETINVEAQQNNPFSLFWFNKQLIALRKRFKAFGNGTTKFLFSENRKVLIFVREFQEECILVITNLCRYSQYVELDLSHYEGCSVVELFGGNAFPKIGQSPYSFTIGPYGYYWFSLQKTTDETFCLIADKNREKIYPTYVVNREGKELFDPSMRNTLEYALKNYLIKRSFFHITQEAIDKTKTKILESFIFQNDEGKTVYLFLYQIVVTGEILMTYPMCLTFLHNDQGREFAQRYPERVVFKTRGMRESYLVDMNEDQLVASFLKKMMKKQKRLTDGHGELRGISLKNSYNNPFIEIVSNKKDVGGVIRQGHILTFPLEQSNIQFFTATHEEMKRDIEIRSFLTHETSFRHFVPLLGYVVYHGVDKKEIIIAVENAAYPNELQAKPLVIEAAATFFMNVKTQGLHFHEEEVTPAISLMQLSKRDFDPTFYQTFHGFLEIVKQLGNVTAEFHKAMESKLMSSDFYPLVYTTFYQRSLFQTLLRKTTKAFLRLKVNYSSGKTQDELKLLTQMETQLIELFGTLKNGKFTGARLRIHGGYEIEHLIYTGKQFLILDFEGNANDPLRTIKRSPLVDVASMLFSLAEMAFLALEKQQERGFFADVDISVANLWAKGWSFWVNAAFLKSYFENMEGVSFLPSNPKHSDFLLGVFLLEKCLAVLNEEESVTSPRAKIALLLLQHWLPIYDQLRPF